MSREAGLATAVERYVEQFEALSVNGTAAAPDWLRARREAAIKQFVDVGFPTTRQEAWRFTDVKPITREIFSLASRAGVEPVEREQVARFLHGDQPGLTAVFVNGHYSDELSSLDRCPEGVKVVSMGAALRSDGDLIERHLGRYAADGVNPFTALSTAFLNDGAFVQVGRDVRLGEPIQLVFLVNPDADQPLMSHPRTLIVVEPGAAASVVETYASLSEGSYWTNAVTEVVVGENARLTAYRIQQESTAAYHTGTTQSQQARNSVYSSTTFVFGGRLTRHDISATLDGEGAEATLNGLSVLSGRQHVDHHTTLVHAKPHCNSWEYFNGIFDERSRGVFNGRIIVKPGAQKTDSKQTSNNLLLSRDARADSQPQLEIYADDVKCTHGATLGPIDERALFYLQSRGFHREEARSMLTYGFAAEILRTVEIEELREDLDLLVKSRLHEGTRTRIAAARS
jgi:Fe-S cluster assembly protein SufD